MNPIYTVSSNPRPSYQSFIDRTGLNPLSDQSEQKLKIDNLLKNSQAFDPLKLPLQPSFKINDPSSFLKPVLPVFKGLASNAFTVCTYDLTKSDVDEEETQFSDALVNKANAFCLQEVDNEDRPLIQALNNNNFEVCHSEFEDGSFDTAVALDKSRFSQIQDHSTVIAINGNYSKDVAIASAIDNNTGKKVVIVSLHAPDFDLTAGPTQQEQDDTALYFEKVADKINKLAPSKIQIIGANMNNNPETYPTPFNYLANRNFDIHRTHAATNDQAKETDFIFTKVVTTLWEKIKSIFCKTITYQGAIKLSLMREDRAEHFPVFAEIDPITEEAKIVQLWKKVCRACKSLFKIK